MAFCVQEVVQARDLDQPVRVITVEPDKLRILLIPQLRQTSLEVLDSTDRIFPPITVICQADPKGVVKQGWRMILNNASTYTIQYTNPLLETSSITLTPASQLSIQGPSFWRTTYHSQPFP